ncbi:hypothetical protein OAN307_c11020 [Octadecabacter antarcticus 307]|uniref:Uncharacterized protein n=1 Tax=Octadecabacter antarcticus 307 TaxID=391626 RepID=M9R3K6_9RHOB|nr:hypothetical protein OAN307_c11020 [Octadecabacter antarcticus 307]
MVSLHSDDAGTGPFTFTARELSRRVGILRSKAVVFVCDQMFCMFPNATSFDAYLIQLFVVQLLQDRLHLSDLDLDMQVFEAFAYSSCDVADGGGCVLKGMLGPVERAACCVAMHFHLRVLSVIARTQFVGCLIGIFRYPKGLGSTKR